MSEPVLLSTQEGIARIVLNRPEIGNAIDEAFGDAFIAAVDRVADDGDIRVLLITGAGNMFCAGGDIEMLRRLGGGLGAHMRRTVQPMHEALAKLAGLPFPVVCAMNGPAGGGGLGIAFCADIILAAESMKMKTGYAAIGLTPDFGVSWFLARLLGPVRAREILLLNRSLSARECLQLGIVNEVLPDAELTMEAAEALVRRLAAGPTAALGRIKRLVGAAATQGLEAHLALERDCMIDSAEAADGREGVGAFIEKRRANFTGR